MRISDWSSDVCSSDLHGRRVLLGAQDEGLAVELRQLGLAVDAGGGFQYRAGQLVPGIAGPVHQARREAGQTAVAVGLGQLLAADVGAAALPIRRPVAQREGREAEG